MKKAFLKLLKFSLFVLGLVPLVSSAQSWAVWNGSQLTLDNGIIKRQVTYDPEEGSFTTSTLNLKGEDKSYLSEGSDEFSFIVNGKQVSGAGQWVVNDFKTISDNQGGHGAKIILLAQKGPAKGLQVELNYLLYPDLPVIRKFLRLVNTSSQELNIENLNMEHLEIQGNVHVPWQRDIGSWLLTDYCRHRTIGPYLGDLHDPVIVVHDIERQRGIALGNESPGVMKRTAVFLDGKSASIGLKYKDENYPFRVWLSPDDEWSSPKTFVALYRSNDDPFYVIDGPVNDFVRKHMGIRLAELKEKPAFVYNTWKPFKMNINEEMILETALAASECGVEEFVIDAGWFEDIGEYKINREKFPNGLRPVFDSIKAMGMKPGLWFGIAYAMKGSDIYESHPEWFLLDSAGQHYNLHTDNEGALARTACFGTGWYDHIKTILIKAIREYGLEYVKLDFSTVCSAYRTDKEVSGCHAHHPLHRDRPESHMVLYNRVWQLFDELHEEAPELFIDCTFETMGGIQLIDYDMCKHAEGNWLSNFKQEGPLGALRIRHMAWWRSPTIPATALVIGNMEINDPHSELLLKSLAGAFPIMLGDPRQVPPEKRQTLRDLSNWLDEMQEKYNYMMFRQDLPGYGEPAEGRWDGFQRINNDDRSGGILGVFRHGSMEKKRQIFINYLDPDREYSILKGTEGEYIGTWTGQELKEDGFPIEILQEYDGVLLEVKGL